MTPLDALRRYLRQWAEIQWGHQTRAARTAALTYSGMYDYVLDRGRVFDSATALTADEVDVVRVAAEEAEAMHGCAFQTRDCFWNAQVLAMSDPTETVRYCEGFAQGHVFPVHHAWATIGGKVVDLTWRRVSLGDEPDAYHEPDDALDRRIVGVAPEGFVYFGCDDYPGSEEMQRRMDEHEVCWSFLDCDDEAEMVDRYSVARVSPRPPMSPAVRMLLEANGMLDEDRQSDGAADVREVRMDTDDMMPWEPEVPPCI